MGLHITEGVRWLYGPVGFPHYRGDLEDLVLSPLQQNEIERQFGIIAVSSATIQWVFVQGQRTQTMPVCVG